MRLANNRDFQKFADWLDIVDHTFVSGAVIGVDENYNADVLRGRAQATGIIKKEMAKASDVAGRIQKIS